MHHILRLLPLLLLGAGLVRADDLNPAPFRGQADASRRVWEFSTNATNPAPSLTTVLGDGATALVLDDPITGTGWYNTTALDGSQQGWWDVGTGSIRFTVPLPAGDPLLGGARVHLQVTYQQGLNDVPRVFAGGVDQSSSSDLLVEAVPPFVQWRSATFAWEQGPIVSPLIIELFGQAGIGAQLDYVAIELSPVPEPAAAGLIAAVVALLLVRRRRLSARR